MRLSAVFSIRSFSWTCSRVVRTSFLSSSESSSLMSNPAELSNSSDFASGSKLIEFSGKKMLPGFTGLSFFYIRWNILCDCC